MLSDNYEFENSSLPKRLIVFSFLDKQYNGHIQYLNFFDYTDAYR